MGNMWRKPGKDARHSGKSEKPVCEIACEPGLRCHWNGCQTRMNRRESKRCSRLWLKLCVTSFERTKEGLGRARAEGKLLGRPKGTISSKLDGREGECPGLSGEGGEHSQCGSDLWRFMVHDEATSW